MILIHYFEKTEMMKRWNCMRIWMKMVRTFGRVLDKNQCPKKSGLQNYLSCEYLIKKVSWGLFRPVSSM